MLALESNLDTLGRHIRYSSGYPTEISPTPADLSVGATVSGAASQVMAVAVPADETQPFGSSLLRAHKGRQ